MQGILARAMLLLEQGRYDLAEGEAKRILAQQPDDGTAHAVLALCRLEAKDWTGALREANEAIRLEPDSAYAHFVAGRVLLDTNRHDSAERAARAAIRLEPMSAANYALLASIHLDRKRWEEALKEAENGLSIDPEDAACNNVRAMALVKLGRREEAGATIATTLMREPENAFTHANRGWGLLHEGKPREAMEHFREALRLDPTMDWARSGIVEALKAHNFIYRWMLAYFLFMSRLSGRAQWGIILGGYFGMRLLKGIGQTNPELEPITQPLVIAYIVFAVMTWLAYPIFNLLLRLNKFGRHALSREQKRASNWIGVTIAAALVCFVLGFVTPWNLLIDIGIMTGLLTLPLAGLFNVPTGWPRLGMGAAMAAVVGIGIFHCVRLYRIGGIETNITIEEWEAQQLVGTYAVGILILTILANALAGTKVKRA